MTVKKAKTTKKKVMKDTWKLTTIPLHSWITFWVLVLATMALATVCFSSAFKNSDGEVDQETVAAFQAIRQSLETQVEDLQGKVSERTDTAKGRALLNDIIEGCNLSWATSTAELYYSYLEPTTKVRASLPYSFAWGNESYALNPIRLGDPSNDPEVEFGPAYLNSCLVRRDAALTIQEKGDSPNEVRASLRQAFPTLAIRERTLGGVTVLSYTNAADNIWPNRWQVFGRTYMYTISSHGWLTDAEAVKIIQSLRVEN
ncbi:hypothetical protein M0Q28_05075 [Patescibacteria group bacterium]|jgi:hypothetical protein|nr:hypothetical protein [Patescibacteria group bacterium]